MVSKPNDWTKTIGRAASRIDDAELTDLRQLQLEYWTRFREHLMERGSPVKPQKPRPQHWTNFAVGRSNFTLHAAVNTREDRIVVGLNCLGDDAKPHFRLLLEDREAIEQEIGGSLDWEELPNRKESKVVLRRPADPTEKADWASQHVWLAETLAKFHAAFSERVKALDASELEEVSVEMDGEGGAPD